MALALLVALPPAAFHELTNFCIACWNAEDFLIA